jgi:hypothetical protein
MKFFIPGIDSREVALEIHGALARLCADQLGMPVTPALLFALRYRMNDSEYLAQVGVSHPPAPESGEVVAIFPTPADFLIWTRDASGNYQLADTVLRSAVSDAEYFNHVDDAVMQPDPDRA